MAFPTVVGSGSTNSGGDIAVPIPAGVAGDYLLMVVGATPGTWSPVAPAGWVKLDSNTTGAATAVALFGRVADGTEAATVTVAAAGFNTAGGMLRIRGRNAIAVSVVATGSSAAPDPNALAPSWGAADTLWCYVDGIANWAGPVSIPAGYTQVVYDRHVPDESVHMGWRQLNAASENPGALGLDASGAWLSWTVGLATLSVAGGFAGEPGGGVW